MNADIADIIEAYYNQPKKLIWVDGKGATVKAAQQSTDETGRQWG